VLHNKFDFWEFFKLLQRENYDSEQILQFIFAKASLSTLVFQECIYNKKYKKV